MSPTPYQRAYELFTQGVRAPPDDMTYPGPVKATPRRIRDGKGRYTMTPSQMHACSRIIDIFEQGHGALLALDMGLGKTLVVLALILQLQEETAKRALHTPPPTSFMGYPLKGKTLIVCPLSLLEHWHRETQTRVKPKLDTLVYHGKDVIDSHPPGLVLCDVVLTTYETVRTQHDAHLKTMSEMEEKKTIHLRTWPLMKLEWNLVVLEEGHRVVNPEASITKAVASLKSRDRLVVTGTPIANDYTDAQSLLSFMRVSPWDDLEFFKKIFIRPRQVGIISGAPVLNHHLNAILATSLRAVTIRILRDGTFDGAPVTNFPLGHVHLIRHGLSPKEREPQELVRDQWDAEGKMGGKGATHHADRKMILRLLTSARLALVHPMCSSAGYSQDPNADDRPSHSLQVLRESFQSKIRHSWRSTRLSLMVDHIHKYLQSAADNKALVFSEFLCILDAAEVALQSQDIQVLRFDGTMDKKTRARHLEKFEAISNRKHRVLLVTSRSGGVGIEMRAAGHVYHLSQPCNSALMEQCSSRTIRTGQEKDVQVFVYHAEASMDEKSRLIIERKDLKGRMLLDPAGELKEAMEEVEGWSYTQFVDAIVQTPGK